MEIRWIGLIHGIFLVYKTGLCVNGEIEQSPVKLKKNKEKV